MTSIFTTQLSYSNWAIKFAYFGSDYTPHRTTLCKLFWRCAFRAFVAGIALALLGHIILFVYLQPITALGILLITAFVALLGLVILGIYLLWEKMTLKLETQKQFNSPRFNLFAEYLMAAKRKVCPIITIENEHLITIENEHSYVVQQR